MTDRLTAALKQLRLSGLLQSLDVRLQEAAGHNLSHAEFLELIVQDELAVRSDRQLQRRLKAACFRELKTLEDFDWLFNPSVPRKQIYDLAGARFIREARDVLLLGPPGLGKSHLVQAIGYHALKAGFVVLYRSIFDVIRDFLHDEALGGEEKVLARYLKPDLLIIDDMGMKQLPKRSGEYLFEIIMRRYETRSTMMTSNRPLEDCKRPVRGQMAVPRLDFPRLGRPRLLDSAGWPTSPNYSTPRRPVTARPPPTCSRSCTTNCASSPPRAWPPRPPSTPSNPPPWCMRRTFGSSGGATTNAGTAAGTSSPPPPRPCAAS
jgi:DNA replication protein DnaC